MTVQPLRSYSDVACGLLEDGKATIIVGGQYGSEAKGCATAWLAATLAEKKWGFDIYTTNAGAQAGHTSIFKGKKRVVFHLPTAPLIARELGLGLGTIYLNAGSIIDPVGLEKEIEENNIDSLYIHPMATIITEDCRSVEMLAESTTTKIASTRKGVGQALARKVMRCGVIAKDHPFTRRFIRRLDLNSRLNGGSSVLVEVPQGVSLSLNHSPFYPYTTSRDCTPGSGLADANIHPMFAGKTMVVLRTFPIRVGNIVEGDKTLGTSGDVYPDQKETSWDELGVEAEITTVTKRIRRVFTFSQHQIVHTFNICRPAVVFLSFVNYLKDNTALDKILESIRIAAATNGMPVPQVILQHGPDVTDVRPL